jgi:hypothetical protein
MNTPNLHPRTATRRFSPESYQAAAREIRRRADRERLEEIWRLLTSCELCERLPQGARCLACRTAETLPGLRP